MLSLTQTTATTSMASRLGAVALNQSILRHQLQQRSFTSSTRTLRISQTKKFTSSARTIHTQSATIRRWQPQSRSSFTHHSIRSAPLTLSVIRSFSTATPPTNSTKNSVTPANSSSTTAEAVAPKLPLSERMSAMVETMRTTDWKKKRAELWVKAKAEARHYWLGTKLLWADIKIATRLVKQITQGHEMTRRERKQLLRTSADLVRMVPFLVILIVPFAEFALPFLLKFFPNMLPSTYLDSTGAEAKLQKQLLVKMEMARFLQETTHLLAQQIAQKKGITSDEALIQAQKFRDFMENVRTGKKVLNSDIVGFSKLFDSELTLENLNKDQLAAMCRFLDIKVFGSVWVLRYKLQEKLRQIQKDDALIQKEGVDALSESELQAACRERGIYTGPGKDISYLKRKLEDWLELSLQHQVPVTLLILSRAFSRQMTGTIQEEPTDLSSDLAQTLAHVPKVVVAEAEKEIADISGDAAAKLQSIKEDEVEAAYEELQARKEGVDRAAKIKQVKTAVGVTQEKLEKLTETNVNVGTLIDKTVAQEEAEAKKLAAKPAPATIPPATPTTPATPATPTAKPAITATTPAVPVSATPATAGVTPAAVAAATEVKKEKKTIAAVDKLNDKVGVILEEIKAQTKKLEAETATGTATTTEAKKEK